VLSKDEGDVLAPAQPKGASLAAQGELRAISPFQGSETLHRRRHPGRRPDQPLRAGILCIRVTSDSNLPPPGPCHKTCMDGRQVAASEKGDKEGPVALVCLAI
jgi:hypothetical protein